MANIILRDYQNQIIQETREHFLNGRKSVLIQLSTGGGKTVIASHMLKSCLDKNMRAYFMCHRRELINQTVKTLHSFQVPSGVISAGYPSHYDYLIQVCSVSTMFRRIKKVKKPTLIFWDEARHIGAKTWSDIYKAFPDAFHVLLDATPTRLDGKPLGDYAKAIVHGPSMRWLIDNNYLSDYKLFAPSTVDLSGVHTRMGDFNKKELDEVMDKPTIIGNAVNEYKKYCDGKRAVVFSVSIKHSEHIRNSFLSAGIPAEHIDGNTHSSDRDRAIENFRTGKTKVLTNVDIASCGLDIPSMEAVILLRPTQSISLYLQQVGRALRPSHGKSHAIILDHVGNWERHGLPDDDREWSLEGRNSFQREKKDDGPSIRVCDNCFAAQISGRSFCKNCGHVFEKQHRQVEERDGNLVQLTREEIEKRRAKAQERKRQGYEKFQAKTLDELVALGQKKGYKNPRGWAKHIFNARQAKKLRGE